MHATETPSEWVTRWAHLVPAGGAVLDIACGAGRHTRFFAARGHEVTAIDRDAQAVTGLESLARVVVADIENGPWALPEDARFAGVVVTNYLWRPLLPRIVGCVDAGGVLIYETFAAGNETVGKPSRPDYLLRPGELLAACAGLRVIAYEDGFLPEPQRYVQRVAAVREPAGALAPRYPLAGTR